MTIEIACTKYVQYSIVTNYVSLWFWPVFCCLLLVRSVLLFCPHLIIPYKAYNCAGLFHLSFSNFRTVPTFFHFEYVVGFLYVVEN